MKKVHAQRLLKLAKFLDELPEERFDLATWVGRSWKGKQDLSCGTTACALGWACTIPEFRKLGARLRPPKPGVLSGPALVGERNSEAIGVAQKLFGLGYEDVKDSYEGYVDLFFSYSYEKGVATTASEVAERIRALVAKQCPNAARNK